MLPRTLLVTFAFIATLVMPRTMQAQEFSRVKECTTTGPAVFCIWIEPQLSPDSQSYAYTDGSGYPPYYEWWPSIIIAAADGSSSLSLDPLVNGWAQSPAWSPDGSQLAFITNSGYDENAIGLWVVDLSTPLMPQNYRQLVKGEDAFEPAWSRDGQQIAYTGQGDIRTVALQGGPPNVLLPGAMSPSWGPEDQIVFVQSGDLWIRQANGDVRQLTNTTWKELTPAWSPDGTWIAYTADRDGNLDIYLKAATGGTAVRLTSAVADETDPSWASDGETLMFRSYVDNDEFWIATNLPDFTVSVVTKSWGAFKRLYR